MSVDEELSIEDVGRHGGNAHVHRHLEIRIDVGGPFFVADGVRGEFGFHSNVLRAPDENVRV